MPRLVEQRHLLRNDLCLFTGRAKSLLLHQAQLLSPPIHLAVQYRDLIFSRTAAALAIVPSGIRNIRSARDVLSVMVRNCFLLFFSFSIFSILSRSFHCRCENIRPFWSVILFDAVKLFRGLQQFIKAEHAWMVLLA